MDFAPIVTRLKDNIAALKLVGGSADIPSAEVQLRTHPAAFILPVAENASDNQLATIAISQRVSVRFGILIAVRNVSDLSGNASLTDLDAIRKSVKTQLMGWVPIAIYDPITYVSGSLVRLDDDAVLWWFDIFETSYFERVT